MVDENTTENVIEPKLTQTIEIFVCLFIFDNDELHLLLSRYSWKDTKFQSKSPRLSDISYFQQWKKLIIVQ